MNAPLFAQPDTLYHVDFDLPDGSKQGPGNPPEWTLEDSQLNLNPPYRHFEVQNKKLEAQNLNGQGEWRSKSVSIPNGDTVNAQVVVGSSGDLGGNDTLIFGYRLNGNGETIVNKLSGYFGTDTLTVLNITGSSIELFVRMENDGNGAGQNQTSYSLHSGTVFTTACPNTAYRLNNNDACFPSTCGQDPHITLCVGEKLTIENEGCVINDNIQTSGLIGSVSTDPNGNNGVANSVLDLSSYSAQIVCQNSQNNNYIFCSNSYPNNIEFNKPGQYYLHLNNKDDCSNTSSICGGDFPTGYSTNPFLIEVIEQPQGSVQLSNNPICEDENTTIEYVGSQSNVGLSIVSGLGGACQVTGTGSSSLDLSACQPGSYLIEVEISNKCGTKTEFVKFTVSESPTADAGPDLKLCEEDLPITIGGNPTASGGTPSYSYSWIGSGNSTNYLNSTSVANPTLLSNTPPGELQLLRHRHRCQWLQGLR